MVYSDQEIKRGQIKVRSNGVKTCQKRLKKKKKEKSIFDAIRKKPGIKKYWN